MIKKTITYNNFNDEEITEDFYFGLLESEIAKLELETKGGMVAKIQKAVDTKEVPELVKIMCDFIDMSFGVKSPDGKYFTKDENDLKLFKSTKAYDKLYMELVTNTKSAIDFVNGIFPKELVNKAMQDPQFKNKLENIQK